MKTETIMLKLDNMCDFVMKSNNFIEFRNRFSQLVFFALLSFRVEGVDNIDLPFKSYIVIKTLNEKLNSIIKKIKNYTTEYDEHIQEDLFLQILMENFPDDYKNYMYQMKHINN